MHQKAIIRVKNVTKKYKLYDKPIDRLKEAIHPIRKKYHHEFTALDNINFEIHRGQTVGIIGKNGSGKSTLLKILTGVLSPTSGVVEVGGKVAALLELGAGFNPELSGYDNVFLNGSLMGYTQQEMREKLDAILDFADIGEFVYQPVKMYSSGMFVRLAFAVAISVEPDILIVDEALSVGDEAFQRKCFSKIRDLKQKGCTILFVSHSGGTIIELCDSAMMIDSGSLIIRSHPKEVVTFYQKLLFSKDSNVVEICREIEEKRKKDDAISDVKEINSYNQDTEYFNPNLVPQSTVNYESNGAKIYNFRLEDLEGNTINILQEQKRYKYCYDVIFQKRCFGVKFGMLIKSISGLEITGKVSHKQGEEISSIEPNSIVSVENEFTCLLQPGTYFVNAGLVGIENSQEVYLHRIVDACIFKVQQDGPSEVTGLVDLLYVTSISSKVKDGSL